MSNQLSAPEDEGAHQNFAQLVVGLHEREQPLAINLDYLACLDHPNSYQPTAPKAC